MSKNLIWAVGIVVVIGAIYFGASALIGDDNSTPAGQEQTEQNNSAPAKQIEQTSSKKVAFSEFVKKGGSYKCTVNQSVGGVNTSGTTYINNSMIRGEYSSQVQGMNINTFFIARDGFTYTWNSMMPNSGFKAKIVAPTEGNSSAPMSASYSFNAETIGDYDCSPWAVDMSKFAIPASVTFQSI
jgi:hypothetical protein